MARKTRRPIPEEILNAPEVSPNNALAWRCYWDLRRGSDVEYAVRWKDVVLWAEVFGCDTDQMEGLQASVCILDRVFLANVRSKSKAAKPPVPPAPKAPRR